MQGGCLRGDGVAVHGVEGRRVEVGLRVGLEAAAGGFGEADVERDAVQSGAVQGLDGLLGRGGVVEPRGQRGSRATYLTKPAPLELLLASRRTRTEDTQ